MVSLRERSSVSWSACLSSASLGLLAVLPLAVLLVNGLYLFVLPYGTKWRSERRAD